MWSFFSLFGQIRGIFGQKRPHYRKFETFFSPCAKRNFQSLIAKFVDKNWRLWCILFRKGWVAELKKILLGVFAVPLLFFGITYTIQDRMLYRNVDNPESREFLQDKPEYSEVEFTADNGKTYRGTMYRATSEKAPLIVYFGGNGDSSAGYMHINEVFERWSNFAGYNCLYIDYEGYGLTEGKADYLSMYEQALAVYDYALGLPEVDSQRIVTIGYSLGTGSAVYLAANRPVSGLILGAPYSNGYDLYNNVIPIFAGPMKLLVKNKLPSEKYAPEVVCPVLMMATEDDKVVPFSSSENLYKHFHEGTEFIVIENADHGSLFYTEEAYDRIRSFLADIALK